MEIEKVNSRDFLGKTGEEMNDDKLVVVPQNKDYSDDTIRALTEFQEQYFKSIIIR